jgi:hypothetical protein
MPAGYAPAKTAYQELRAAVRPWAKSQGFRRWPGTQAGWQKALDAGQLLGFKCEGDGMVNPDTGNSMHGLVQLEPSSGAATAHSMRQATFSRCLVRSELDQLARIQGVVNKRRPRLPGYLEKDARQDSLLGRHLRELYDPAPQYREEQSIELEYYSIEDVRDFVTFILAVLPGVLDRFLEGRIANAIDTMPPTCSPRGSAACHPLPASRDVP